MTTASNHNCRRQIGGRSARAMLDVFLLVLNCSATDALCFVPGRRLRVSSLKSKHFAIQDQHQGFSTHPSPSYRTRHKRRNGVSSLKASIVDGSSETTVKDRFFHLVEDARPSYLEPRMELDEKTLGLLVLLSVPMAWGTYVPVVRGLYQIDPPIPGSVFSAAYFTVAAISTWMMIFFQRYATASADERELHQDQKYSDIVELPQSILPLYSKNGHPIGEICSSLNVAVSDGPFPWLQGAELALYVFTANALQVVGLKTVPSDRAGFLIQLSTILVPLVHATMKGNLMSVPRRTWFACALALAGIGVMGLDQSGTANEGLAPSFSSGDLLLIASALLYTMNVIRLGDISSKTTPLKLAASKTVTEAILSCGFVAALASAASCGTIPCEATDFISQFFRESGTEIMTFWDSMHHRLAEGSISSDSMFKAAFATLWTGCIATSYVIMAQSYGQRKIAPTDANLIYSLQPIFTSLFAFMLLGETMAPVGLVGGSLIGAAVYMVARNSSVSDGKKDEGR